MRLMSIHSRAGQDAPDMVRARADMHGHADALRLSLGASNETSPPHAFACVPCIRSQTGYI